jgi:OOP family OmpA-OmpF porin
MTAAGFRSACVRAARVAVATLLGLPVGARAEQTRNLDLPRFDPAPAGDRFFGVPSAYTPGNRALHAGVLADYAHNPLVLADARGSIQARIVEHQLLVHLNAAWMVFGRLQLHADLPFAPVNRGQGRFESGPFSGDDAFVSPKGAGLGDLRLGARTQIVGEYIPALQIALGASVWLPTATKNDFLGNGHARAQGHLLVGGYVDRLIWAAMIGPTFRSSQSYGGVEVASQLNWGGGIGVLLGQDRDLQLGIETSGGVTLGAPRWDSTNGEALAGIRYRGITPIAIGLALSRGFALNLGTPDLRAIFSVAYASQPRR